MQKAKREYHNGGGKEKDAEFYLKNKDTMKEKGRNKYKNLSEEEKEAKKEHEKNIKKGIQTEKKNLANRVSKK